MTSQTNIYTLPTDGKIFSKTVNINSPTSKVWEALTDPELMKKWMFDKEINIITNWKVGNPVVIRGNMNGKTFENNGAVLQFEIEKILQRGK